MYVLYAIISNILFIIIISPKKKSIKHIYSQRETSITFENKSVLVVWSEYRWIVFSLDTDDLFDKNHKNVCE